MEQFINFITQHYLLFDIIIIGGYTMFSCEFVTFISTLAGTIAKGKTQKEINILAAFFTQLGDTLATISTLDSD